MADSPRTKHGQQGPSEGNHKRFLASHSSQTSSSPEGSIPQLPHRAAIPTPHLASPLAPITPEVQAPGAAKWTASPSHSSLQTHHSTCHGLTGEQPFWSKMERQAAPHAEPNVAESQATMQNLSTIAQILKAGAEDEDSMDFGSEPDVTSPPIQPPAARSDCRVARQPRPRVTVPDAGEEDLPAEISVDLATQPDPLWALSHAGHSGRLASPVLEEIAALSPLNVCTAGSFYTADEPGNAACPVEQVQQSAEPSSSASSGHNTEAEAGSNQQLLAEVSRLQERKQSGSFDMYPHRYSGDYKHDEARHAGHRTHILHQKALSKQPDEQEPSVGPLGVPRVGAQAKQDTWRCMSNPAIADEPGGGELDALPQVGWEPLHRATDVHGHKIIPVVGIPGSSDSSSSEGSAAWVPCVPLNEAMDADIDTFASHLASSIFTPPGFGIAGANESSPTRDLYAHNSRLVAGGADLAAGHSGRDDNSPQHDQSLDTVHVHVSHLAAAAAGLHAAGEPLPEASELAEAALDPSSTVDSDSAVVSVYMAHTGTQPEETPALGASRAGSGQATHMNYKAALQTGIEAGGTVGGEKQLDTLSQGWPKLPAAEDIAGGVASRGNSESLLHEDEKILGGIRDMGPAQCELGAEEKMSSSGTTAAGLGHGMEDEGRQAQACRAPHPHAASHQRHGQGVGRLMDYIHQSGENVGLLATKDEVNEVAAAAGALAHLGQHVSEAAAAAEVACHPDELVDIMCSFTNKPEPNLVPLARAINAIEHLPGGSTLKGAHRQHVFPAMHALDYAAAHTGHQVLLKLQHKDPPARQPVPTVPHCGEAAGASSSQSSQPGLRAASTTTDQQWEGATLRAGAMEPVVNSDTSGSATSLPSGVPDAGDIGQDFLDARHEVIHMAASAGAFAHLGRHIAEAAAAADIAHHPAQLMDMAAATTNEAEPNVTQQERLAAVQMWQSSVTRSRSQELEGQDTDREVVWQMVDNQLATSPRLPSPRITLAAMDDAGAVRVTDDIQETETSEQSLMDTNSLVGRLAASAAGLHLAGEPLNRAANMAEAAFEPAHTVDFDSALVSMAKALSTNAPVDLNDTNLVYEDTTSKDTSFLPSETSVPEPGTSTDDSTAASGNSPGLSTGTALQITMQGIGKISNNSFCELPLSSSLLRQSTLDQATGLPAGDTRNLGVSIADVVGAFSEAERSGPSTPHTPSGQHRDMVARAAAAAGGLVSVGNHVRRAADLAQVATTPADVVDATSAYGGTASTSFFAPTSPATHAPTDATAGADDGSAPCTDPAGPGRVNCTDMSVPLAASAELPRHGANLDTAGTPLLIARNLSARAAASAAALHYIGLDIPTAALDAEVALSPAKALELKSALECRTGSKDPYFSSIHDASSSATACSSDHPMWDMPETASVCAASMMTMAGTSVRSSIKDSVNESSSSSSNSDGPSHHGSAWSLGLSPGTHEPAVPSQSGRPSTSGSGCQWTDTVKHKSNPTALPEQQLTDALQHEFRSLVGDVAGTRSGGLKELGHQFPRTLTSPAQQLAKLPVMDDQCPAGYIGVTTGWGGAQGLNTARLATRAEMVYAFAPEVDLAPGGSTRGLDPMGTGQAYQEPSVSSKELAHEPYTTAQDHSPQTAAESVAESVAGLTRESCTTTRCTCSPQKLQRVAKQLDLQLNPQLFAKPSAYCSEGWLSPSPVQPESDPWSALPKDKAIAAEVQAARELSQQSAAAQGGFVTPQQGVMATTREVVMATEAGAESTQEGPGVDVATTQAMSVTTEAGVVTAREVAVTNEALPMDKAIAAEVQAARELSQQSAAVQAGFVTPQQGVMATSREVVMAAEAGAEATLVEPAATGADVVTLQEVSVITEAGVVTAWEGGVTNEAGVVATQAVPVTIETSFLTTQAGGYMTTQAGVVTTRPDPIDTQAGSMTAQTGPMEAQPDPMLTQAAQVDPVATQAGHFTTNWAAASTNRTQLYSEQSEQRQYAITDMPATIDDAMSCRLPEPVASPARPIGSFTHVHSEMQPLPEQSTLIQRDSERQPTKQQSLLNQTDSDMQPLQQLSTLNRAASDMQPLLRQSTQSAPYLPTADEALLHIADEDYEMVPKMTPELKVESEAEAVKVLLADAAEGPRLEGMPSQQHEGQPDECPERISEQEGFEQSESAKCPLSLNGEVPVQQVEHQEDTLEEAIDTATAQAERTAREREQHFDFLTPSPLALGLEQYADIGNPHLDSQRHEEWAGSSTGMPESQVNKRYTGAPVAVAFPVLSLSSSDGTDEVPSPTLQNPQLHISFLTDDPSTTPSPEDSSLVGQDQQAALEDLQACLLQQAPSLGYDPSRKREGAATLEHGSQEDMLPIASQAGMLPCGMFKGAEDLTPAPVLGELGSIVTSDSALDELGVGRISPLTRFAASDPSPRTQPPTPCQLEQKPSEGVTYLPRGEECSMHGVYPLASDVPLAYASRLKPVAAYAAVEPSAESTAAYAGENPDIDTQSRNASRDASRRDAYGQRLAADGVQVPFLPAQAGPDVLPVVSAPSLAASLPDVVGTILPSLDVLMPGAAQDEEPSMPAGCVDSAVLQDVPLGSRASSMACDPSSLSLSPPSEFLPLPGRASSGPHTPSPGNLGVSTTDVQAGCPARKVAGATDMAHQNAHSMHVGGVSFHPDRPGLDLCTSDVPANAALINTYSEMASSGDISGGISGDVSGDRSGGSGCQHSGGLCVTLDRGGAGGDIQDVDQCHGSGALLHSPQIPMGVPVELMEMHDVAATATAAVARAVALGEPVSVAVELVEPAVWHDLGMDASLSGNSDYYSVEAKDPATEIDLSQITGHALEELMGSETLLESQLHHQANTSHAVEQHQAATLTNGNCSRQIHKPDAQEARNTTERNTNNGPSSTPTATALSVSASSSPDVVLPANEAVDLPTIEPMELLAMELVQHTDTEPLDCATTRTLCLQDLKPLTSLQAEEGQELLNAEPGHGGDDSDGVLVSLSQLQQLPRHGAEEEQLMSCSMHPWEASSVDGGLVSFSELQNLSTTPSDLEGEAPHPNHSCLEGAKQLLTQSPQPCSDDTAGASCSTDPLLVPPVRPPWATDASTLEEEGMLNQQRSCNCAGASALQEPSISRLKPLVVDSNSREQRGQSQLGPGCRTALLEECCSYRANSSGILGSSTGYTGQDQAVLQPATTQVVPGVRTQYGVGGNGDVQGGQEHLACVGEGEIHDVVAGWPRDLLQAAEAEGMCIRHSRGAHLPAVEGDPTLPHTPVIGHRTLESLPNPPVGHTLSTALSTAPSLQGWLPEDGIPVDPAEEMCLLHDQAAAAAAAAKLHAVGEPVGNAVGIAESTQGVGTPVPPALAVTAPSNREDAEQLGMEAACAAVAGHDLLHAVQQRKCDDNKIAPAGLGSYSPGQSDE